MAYFWNNNQTPQESSVFFFIFELGHSYQTSYHQKKARHNKTTNKNRNQI